MNTRPENNDYTLGCDKYEKSKKPAHSPSPWRLHNMEPMVVVDKKGWAVADCSSFSHTRTENHANSLLVIAAPELLACLKIALEESKDFLPYIREAFEKTIAKAEGGKS